MKNIHLAYMVLSCDVGSDRKNKSLRAGFRNDFLAKISWGSLASLGENMKVKVFRAPYKDSPSSNPPSIRHFWSLSLALPERFLSHYWLRNIWGATSWSWEVWPDLLSLLPPQLPGKWSRRKRNKCLRLWWWTLHNWPLPSLILFPTPSMTA